MELRQSTAVTIKLGPFLDSSNGNDEEAALTINQADVKLSKNGGALAQKTEVSACAYDANGMYDCDLDATDTNTLGRLKVICHVAGALFVWHNFMVITQADWDARYGTGIIAAIDTAIGGGVVDVLTRDEVLKRLLAAASGDYAGALTGVVVFKEQDDVTTEFTATITGDARTIS